MRKQFLLPALCLTLLAGSAAAAQDGNGIGVVNFSTCAADSKCGKREQENFDILRKQMTSRIEDTDKEIKEIASKFEDTEYLDSLSPKAEEELRTKFQGLQDDLGRYQNQFYQVMQQTNYHVVHKINAEISSAAEKIAKSKKFDYVISKEVCFYIRPELDLTALVIDEMDRAFESEAKSKKLSDNSEAPTINAVDATVLDKAG